MFPNLEADYLGLTLKSPLIIGACPLTLNLETVRLLECAGVGAVTLPSLFEEQIVQFQRASGADLSPSDEALEGVGYDSCEDRYNGGPSYYLQTLSRLKNVSRLPIIASLDGYTSGQWLQFAGQLEAYGADAIELNLHTHAADPSLNANEVEARLLHCVRQVCQRVSIPVSIKLLPTFTNLSNFAWRLADSGAAGAIVFGREADWEITLDRVRKTTLWSLTAGGNIASAVSGMVRVRSGGPPLSMAASGGIASSSDVLKAIFAGGDVAMMTSELYRHGPDAVRRAIEGVRVYLTQHHYPSFRDLIEDRPAPEASGGHRLEFLRPLANQPDEDAQAQGRAQAQVPQAGDRWGHASI